MRLQVCLAFTTVLAGLESDATFHRYDLLWTPLEDMGGRRKSYYWESGQKFNSLPREVVEQPSLGCSKPNLIIHSPEQPAPVNSAFWARVLEWTVFRGPFQPHWFWNSSMSVIFETTSGDTVWQSLQERFIGCGLLIKIVSCSSCTCLRHVRERTMTQSPVLLFDSN